MKVKTKSSEETKKVARDLMQKLASGSYSSSEARSLKRNSSHPLKDGSNNKYTNVLCLYGDLGAGKTTFTQGLAEYFGVKRIISPTFVLIREYPFFCHSRSNRESIKIDPRVKPEDDRVLYHIDLYRLDSLEEIKNLGIEEIMTDKNNFVVIEWADKLKELLPKNRMDIYLKYLSDTEREITISSL